MNDSSNNSKDIAEVSEPEARPSSAASDLSGGDQRAPTDAPTTNALDATSANTIT